MQVTLKSIVQSIDLDSGMMKNSLVVVLPNGETTVLPIDEATLDALLRAQRGQPPSEKSPSMPTTTEYGTGGEDLEEMVSKDEVENSALFGGDQQPQPGPPPQPQPRQRARQVSTDSWGYPIVERQAGAIDPGEVIDTPSDDSDEDGVSSI